MASSYYQASDVQMVGSFAAASNVTGIIEEVDAVTTLLHRFGALACWDYASAAPHGPIDMNPTLSMNHLASAGGAAAAATAAADPHADGGGVVADIRLAAKDAVFISPHKFPGGPGTPGLLVVKKALLQNAVPGTPGGGTVFYVTEQSHRYLENLEEYVVVLAVHQYVDAHTQPWI